MQSYSNTDEMEIESEYSYLTLLQMPKFEKRFRKEIIRPLTNLVHKSFSDQVDILTDIRYKLHYIQQGVYLDCKDVFLESEAVDDEHKNKIRTDHSFTIPFIDLEEDIYLKSDEASNSDFLDEIRFVDPEALAVVKSKLLPQVIKILLSLDCKDGNVTEFICPQAEGIVAGVLLDFVRFISEVLHVANQAMNGLQDHHRYSNNDDTKQSRKRSRNEMGDVHKNNCPNILNILGENLLEVVSKLLAVDSCFAGHIQSMRKIKGEDWQHDLPQDDIIQKNLPIFYKSTNTKEREKWNDEHRNDKGKGFYCHIMTGEWSLYYKLYCPANAVTELVKQALVPTFTKHMVAIVFLFIQGSCVRNLVKCVERYLEQSDESVVEVERIDCTVFKPTMQIMQSLSYICSYISEKIDPENLGVFSTVCNDLEKFRHASLEYITSIRVGIDVLTPEHCRSIMETLKILDDRNSGVESRLDESGQEFLLKIVIDFCQDDVDNMRTEMMWRLLTGNNTHQTNEEQSIQPPIQCQLFGLNELRSWLQSLEMQMLQYETEYEKLLNGTASDQPTSSQLDSKSQLCSRENMGKSLNQNELHNDSIMIVDEGPGSKQTKDSKAVHIEKIINLSEVQNENDVIVLDNESTEARCNSKASVSSNDEHPSKFAKRQKLDDSSHLEDESTVISSSHQLAVGHLMEQMRLRFLKVIDIVTSGKYNVLDVLMSKNVHRELLKRVFPVLQLLTKHSRLNSNHILLLWNLSGFTKDAAESLHVSVTSIILDVLIDLLNFNNWRGASKHAFSYLNSLFLSVEKDMAWDIQKLKFLDAMVRRSVDILVEDNSDTAVIPGCMHTLWELSNHSNCVNCTNEICYQAYLHLSSLFEWIFSRKATDMSQSFLSLRSNITKMIIASLESDTEHHRFPSVNFLCLILNRLEFREPGLSNDSSELACIDDILESFDLTGIIIREMVSFSNTVQKARQEESAHLFDDSLKGVEIRVNLFKELIRVLISLQEEVHNTIPSGRKRLRDDNHLGHNGLDSISRNRDPMTNFPDLVQIKNLWESFVKGCSGLEASDLILNTFHFLLSSRSLVGKCLKFDTWRKDTEKTLFPLCRNIHPSSMTLSTYRLLIYCIGNINAIEGKYEIRPFDRRTCNHFEHSQILLGNSLGNEGSDNVVGETSDVYYVSNVIDHEIEGIDLLWKLVLEGNDIVADLAMTYMSILYTFECNEATRMVQQQQDLIDHCFSILSQECKDLSSIHHIKRILCLVTLFVKSVYRSSGLKFGEVLDLVSHGRSGDDVHKAQVDSILGINSPFNIVLKGVKGEVNTVQCPYGARTTLGYIRKIASKLRKFPTIRLIFAGKELKDDNVTMSSLGITEGSSIVYIPFVTVTHEVKEINDNVHAIDEVVCKSSDDSKKSLIYDSTRCFDYRSLQSKFLTDYGVEQFAADEKLEVIFSLFAIRQDSRVNSKKFLHSQIWELLQLLPTNSDLEKNIAEVFSGNTKITWLNILPMPSTSLEGYKLLYNLQALERNFLKSEEGEEKEKLQEAAIIEDENTILHIQGVNTRKISSNSNAVVILDDDDLKTCDGVPAANVMNSASLCEVMKFGGGIEHLLDLLESVDVNFNNFDENEFDECVARLLSFHKIAFLLSFLLYEEVDQSKLDDRVILSISKRGSLFSIVTKLFEVINATLTFQNLYAGYSASLVGSYSLFDISSALVVRCFSMTRAIILSSMKTCSYFLCTYCANIGTSASSKMMCDLIQLVLFHASTEKLCASGHSLLMDIFLLHENSDRVAFTTELSKESNGTIRSNILSLLIVVFEQEHMKVENMNSKKSQAFLGLFQTCITLMWSEMDFNEKEALILDLQTTLKEFTPTPSSAEFEKFSRQSRVASFFELFIWTINSCFRLATHNNTLECEVSLASFLQLLSHLLATIEDRKVKELIASIGTPSGLIFIQALLQKMTFSDTDDENTTTLSLTTVMEIGNMAKVLCQSCESNQFHFINFFNRLFLQESPRHDLADSWNYDPTLLEKNNEIHLVGLKNQGATCYMNSLLQQLFFIQRFRDSILFGLEENILCSIDNDDSDEETKKMLIEIRNLFGSLYLSDHKYYDTADLVATIKGYDGSYIRPSEQQDVDEFFNLFSDRLETALNGTSQSRLLHDIFGGKLSHLIKCKECGYCSERTEDYLSISLDVKGKNNMTESLKSYIRGDLLDGSNQYFCSKCNEKRDSVKRCCIKDLPETLICHLKRFEFDLESLRKVKVNDRFEYPLELNLQEYTVEGIDENRKELNQPERDESYYNYKLRGVLVHMGTAESGHYYSICSIRDIDTGVASNISKSTNDEWYRCNDSTVTKFDPKTLADATFGGTSTNTTASFHHKRNFSSSEKNYSAYLLIYDRVKSAGLQTGPPAPLSKGYNQGTKPDLSWAKDIWALNNRNRLDKILFSSNFSKLLDAVCLHREKQTSSTSVTMASLEGIKILTLYSFDYVLHSCLKDCEIKELFSRLISLFEVDISVCTWFVSIMSKSHQFWLEKIFCKCTSETIRSCFVKFLSLIFRVTIPEQQNHYYEIEDDVSREGENDCFDCDDDVICLSLSPSTSPTRLGRFFYWRSKADLVQCVGILMDLILAPRYGMKIFDQLFEALHLFALNGVEESLLLVRSGVILKLVHVLLGEDSTIPSASIILSPSSKQKFSSHQSLSTKCKKTNLNSLKALIAHLSRYANIALDDSSDVSDSDSDSDSNNEPERNVGPGREESPYLMDRNEAKTAIQMLPVRDSRALCRNDVLVLMMTSNKSESFDLKNNITHHMIHLCFNNIDMTRLVCEVAEIIVKDKKYYQAETALDTLLSLIHIDDRFTKQRVAFVFKSIMAVIQENIEFEKETSCILNSIFVELTARTEKKAQNGLIEFYNHIVEHFEHLASMLTFHEASKAIVHSYGALLHALVSIDCEKKIDFKSSDDVIRLRYGGRSVHCLFQVREKIELSKYLPQGKLIPFSNIEALKDIIFIDLVKRINSLHKHLETDENKILQFLQVKDNREEIDAIIESSSFSEYFSALRCCLKGPRGKVRADTNTKLIESLVKEVLEIFWKVDDAVRSSKRYHADILKGEIVLLLDELLILDPTQTVAVLEDKGAIDDIFTQMIEVYVTTSTYAEYNNSYTMNFYKFLIGLAKYSHSFLKIILNHNNWLWSIGSFVLNQDLSSQTPLYEILLKGTKGFIQLHSDFRQKVYKKLLETSHLFSQDSPDRGTLELLVSIFHSESSMILNGSQPVCVDNFLSSEVRGLSKLSTSLNHSFERWRKCQGKEEEQIILVSLCLEALIKINQLLGHSHFFSSLKSTDIWPEVEGVTLLLPQIVAFLSSKDHSHDETSIKIIEKIESLENILKNKK